MTGKPYKRLEGGSLLADPAINSKGQKGKPQAYFANISSFETNEKVFYSRQRIIYYIFVIISALIFISVATSIAKPIEGCLVEYDLSEYKHSAPVSRAEERTEEEPKAKTGEIFPWNDRRLPSFILPIHYDLLMFPNLETFENSGSVNITFRITRETYFIVLHSKDLNFSSIVLTQNNGTEIPVLQHLEYPKHEQVYIRIGGNLVPSLEYKLSIDFESYLKENLQGFYLSSYKNEEGQKRYLATTHFQPFGARSAFPCFDEPDMKATFQLKMVHDINYRAYFNSEILEIAPYSQELSISSFHKTVRMSTYLVAFLVCDFTEREITSIDDVNIRLLVPPEQCGESEFAIEIAAEILHFYKTFFNISYPLSKLDMAAIPDLISNAMENWGLVTFRTFSVLYNPSETSANGQRTVATVIAHELAHQWFGNLVTMKWWNDIWLNEGFASFMESVALDNISSEWKMMDEFGVIVTQHALDSDSLLSSHPIITETVDSLEIHALFDVISYRKGAAILNMLADFLGMETLQKGLSYYLKKYSFQNARTEDLWNIFTEVDLSHINVSQIMDTWTRQKGYPLITVTFEHPMVKVKQERYLLRAPESDNISSSDVSAYGYKWFVPVTYVTDLTNEQKTYWLNMSNGEFVLPAEAQWLKVNVNQTGFYRVMYDNALWTKLIDVLHSNHTVFSPADRANLVDDALSFTRAGILDAVLAFNLTRYLEKEEEYAPWQSALFRFEYINVIVQDNPIFLSLFQKYMVKLLKPALSALGFEDKGSHTQKKLRSALLEAAILYGEEQTVSRAKQMFQDWMQNGVKIPPNLRSAVYKAGVKYGGKEEWEFCWRQYQETQVPSEENLLISALASTRDKSQLSLYLNYSMDKDKIRPQDMFIAIIYSARNLIGRSITWRFVRSNWNRFLETFEEGSIVLGFIMRETVSYFTTQAAYDEVEAFFRDVNVGAAMDSLEQSLETIKINKQWRENLEAYVPKWLQENVS